MQENAGPASEPPVESRPRRIAVIDLGSNTARLIVMRSLPGYSFRLEEEIREVVRLWHGMTEEGLSAEAVRRALSTLRLFKRFCESLRVDHLHAVATSAVREAANGAAFVEQVRQELGLSLRVLAGDQEAYYGTVGALNEVPLTRGFVVDIGGGSAQISEVRSGKFFRGASLTLGALALTDRWVRSDPITPAEYGALKAEIERQLGTVAWCKKRQGAELVGIGGTIRNLARMEAERQAYPLNTLHGFVLRRSSVEESIDQFRALSLASRRKLPGLHGDRADIILPGAMVVLVAMKRLGINRLTVSRNGLREGIFLEQFWQHLPYPVFADVRRFGLLNLARTYSYAKPHAQHVQYLAGRVFDQLAPLHQYGAGERELLDAAALLHDIGYVIDFAGHDRHSQTLIEYNGLPGFSPREIALIGLVARFHWRGDPGIDGYQMLLNEADLVLLRQLAAILRLAECLERGQTATVDDLLLSWDKDSLHLSLVADDYPAVELWQAEKNAVPLLEVALGRQVRLSSACPPP